MYFVFKHSIALTQIRRPDIKKPILIKCYTLWLHPGPNFCESEHCSQAVPEKPSSHSHVPLPSNPSSHCNNNHNEP